MGLSDLFWNGRRPDSLNVEAFPYQLEAPLSAGFGDLVLGLLVTAFCIWMLWTQAGRTISIDPAKAIFLALVSAAGLAMTTAGGWRVLRPDLLALSDDGLEFRTLWRRGYWRWTQVRNFRVERSRHPKIVFEIDGVAAPSWLSPRHLSMRWPVSADRLVNVLNHAKLQLDPGDVSRRSVVALTT